MKAKRPGGSNKDDPWKEYYHLPRDDVSDTDVWRSAHQMLKLFSEDAMMNACQRADKALAMGDLFNFNFWTRITTAVREIERQKPIGD